MGRVVRVVGVGPVVDVVRVVDAVGVIDVVADESMPIPPLWREPASSGDGTGCVLDPDRPDRLWREPAAHVAAGQLDGAAQQRQAVRLLDGAQQAIEVARLSHGAGVRR